MGSRGLGSCHTTSGSRWGLSPVASCEGLGAVVIDSRGFVLPIPALEMRSSPSAEPAGRPELVPTPDLPQIGAAAPSRWRPPHLQGFSSRRSPRWRCARPRARSPQGDRNLCLPQTFPRSSLSSPPCATVTGGDAPEREPHPGARRGQWVSSERTGGSLCHPPSRARTHRPPQT